MSHPPPAAGAGLRSFTLDYRDHHVVVEVDVRALVLAARRREPRCTMPSRCSIGARGAACRRAHRRTTTQDSAGSSTMTSAPGPASGRSLGAEMLTQFELAAAQEEFDARPHVADERYPARRGGSAQRRQSGKDVHVFRTDGERQRHRPPGRHPAPTAPRTPPRRSEPSSRPRMPCIDEVAAADEVGHESSCRTAVDLERRSHPAAPGPCSSPPPGPTSSSPRAGRG